MEMQHYWPQGSTCSQHGARSGCAHKGARGPEPDESTIGPFTNWGQFGADGFDLRVFDQAEYWVDRDGRPRALSKMTDAEVARLGEYLRTHANHFYVENLRRVVIARILGSVSSPPIELVFPGAPDLAEPTDQSPQEWLASTPLMCAIESRSAGRPGLTAGGPER